MAKQRICIIFGGYSAEHDVSIMSAAAIGAAIDHNRYQCSFIGFDKKNHPHQFAALTSQTSKQLFNGDHRISFETLTAYLREQVDVAFPIIHGPGGEDGTLQGFLSYLAVPYIGADVSASSACMDKRLTKIVLRQHGVQVVEDISVTSSQYAADAEAIHQTIAQRFTFPVFVKPSSLGSSIGVSKVKSAERLSVAIKNALSYDRAVIIEQGVEARELECAVIGNQQPRALAIGEIIPSHEIYDYQAKYCDDALSELIIPAQLSTALSDQIKQIAVRAYRALGVTGMARVDFLVDKQDQTIYLNELNTLPGFTKYSMYPRLAAQGGLSFGRLISELIELAQER